MTESAAENGEPSARDIRVAPIRRADADRAVQRLHYSGTVVRNSQLHLGVFLAGRLEGVMQFGPSMDKRKALTLVAGTAWNGFLELNRMAFSDRLPRNSESRAMGVALRMIRRTYPHIEWILSYADAAQCGDGTIYRAAGFLLTGIKPNRAMMRMPDGTILANNVLTSHWNEAKARELCARLGIEHRAYSETEWIAMGAQSLPGFQIRYLMPMQPGVAARIVPPVLPYSAIAEAGAGMYLGRAK